jgi:hypothetical protein
MPTWKYTDKNVSKEKAEESLRAIKSACLGCDTHNEDCSIAKAAGEVSDMLGCECRHSLPGVEDCTLASEIVALEAGPIPPDYE